MPCPRQCCWLVVKHGAEFIPFPSRPFVARSTCGWYGGTMKLGRNFLREAQQGQIFRRETYGEFVVGSDLVVGEDFPIAQRSLQILSKKPICLFPVVPLVVVRAGTFVDVPTQGILFSIQLEDRPDGVEDKPLSQRCPETTIVVGVVNQERGWRRTQGDKMGVVVAVE